MKLDTTSATAKTLSRTENEAARPPADASQWHIDPASAADPDRRHSLRQEVDSIQAAAVGPYAGEDQARQEAQVVAEELARLGAKATELVRRDGDLPRWHAVDAKA